MLQTLDKETQKFATIYRYDGNDTENGYSTGHYAAVGGIVGYTNGGRSF